MSIIVYNAPDPLAVVVIDEERAADAIAPVLRARGLRTFVVDAACADHATISGLQPKVVVFAVRRDVASVARSLAELSKSSSPPPALLVADDPDAVRVAARFGLLVSRADEHELAWAVERTRREGRRPSAAR